MKFLSKARLVTVLDRLAADARLYIPLKNGSSSSFGLWSAERAADLSLDSLNTTFPPKSVVFPQTEKMYDFAVDGPKAEITRTHAETGRSIVFGVRACDRKALADLDQVFLTRDYLDTHYQARRERLIVIGATCALPGRFCFCTSMGVDPMGANASDVLLHQTPDGYAWEPVTEAGHALTNLLDDLLSDAGDVVKEPAVDCQLQVRVDGLSEKLNGLFNDQAWDELSSRCINCGICTYVCPSCHCFDIQVKNRGQEGSRFRCWDSCMYPDYNLMAGGHNTRASKRDRFRNRFLHKLEFFRERYGTFSCSGCGRCLVMCPNGISIVSVINRFGEVGPDVS